MGLLVVASLSGASAAAAQPDDPLFVQQWALQPGGPLDVTKAWEVGNGAGSVVAVVDSGVDLTHPDLRGALWTNPGEIPGNGVDDDHDGYVDDVHGIDAVTGSGDPTDVDGHGTHVAGIIAAAVNGIGSVGIAPGAKIMAVRVLGKGSQGTTTDVATGIRYAVAHGATVINASLSANGDDPALHAAIAQATAAGIPVVVAAGNSAENISLTPSYPAAYTIADQVSVAALSFNGLLASFSNFGQIVSIAAPGVDIPSTASDGGYEDRSGTSQAAPEVAAALAVMHSARPDLPMGQLTTTLLSTSRRLKGLSGLLGGGEVDLVAALRRIVPAGRWPATQLTARVRTRARQARRTLVTWMLGGDTEPVAHFRVSGAHGVTLARRGGSARGVWIKARHGRVRVAALNSAGATLAAVTITL